MSVALRRLFIVAMLVVPLLHEAPAISTVAAEQSEARPGATGNVLVLFRPDVSAARRAAAVQRHANGAATVTRANLPRLALVRSTPDQASVVAARLRGDAAVLRAAPDRRVNLSSIPGEYSSSAQPALARIGAPAAWNAGFDGTGVTIAVLDTGLDTGHPAFPPARVVAPAVFITDPSPSAFCGPTSTDVLDNNGHGTHVAGIAAAGANSSQAVGVAWASRVMPVKVLDACGSGSYFDIVQGMFYAVNNGARVINLSLGGYLSPNNPGDAELIGIVQAAVDYARGKHVVVVAASGNDGVNLAETPYYPASADHVIAIGATALDDQATTFSNRGPAVAASAPGVGVWSTLPTYPTAGVDALTYGYLSGTSMASPHVAGLAALLMQRELTLTADDVTAQVIGSTVDLGTKGRDPLFGVGRIDVGAALTRSVPAPVRYFAEGYTGSGFTAFLTLQNATDQPVVTLLRFQYDGPAGDLPSRQYIGLPAASRTTIGLNELVGSGRAFSTIVAADSTGVFVERPMYFSYRPSTGGMPVDGGHLSIGAARPATKWFLAEGWTGAGFDEYLTIQNPNPTSADVVVAYAPSSGSPTERRVTVPATGRSTISVHGPSPGIGRDQAVAVRVESVNQVGVTVERPMYFRYGAGITGGHTTPGAAVPSATWYFAEGYTGAGFDEYLTLYNPTSVAGHADLLYAVDNGPPIARRVAVPANQRTTVLVHEPMSPANPGGLGRGYAAALKVKSDVPLVAERPMYFVYRDAAGRSVNGGHTTLGAIEPRSAWNFAEGYTGDGFDEFLAIFNPETTPVDVQITYYLEGAPPRVVNQTVGAERRSTIAVYDNIQGVGRGKAVSAVVKAQGNRKIVAERVVYFTFAGNLTGGHVALGQ